MAEALWAAIIGVLFIFFGTHDKAISQFFMLRQFGATRFPVRGPSASQFPHLCQARAGVAAALGRLRTAGRREGRCGRVLNIPAFSQQPAAGGVGQTLGRRAYCWCNLRSVPAPCPDHCHCRPERSRHDGRGRLRYKCAGHHRGLRSVVRLNRVQGNQRGRRRKLSSVYSSETELSPRMVAGEKLTADKALVDHFLKPFPSNVHSKLRGLVTTFLDPKKPEVRAHISRMLHARFCVEASGLAW